MDALASAAAAIGISVDQLIAIKRRLALEAMSPEERAAASAAEQYAVAALEAPPLDGAAGRVAARRARPRPISSDAPLCNRCGRTRSQRDIPYPFGWNPPPNVRGEELTEDEVPLACCRWLEIGSPEDKAYREIECLRWAKRTGWVAIPDPPPDPLCKFCRRLRGSDEGQCHRDIETGSADDRAARAMECSVVAADLL